MNVMDDKHLKFEDHTGLGYARGTWVLMERQGSSRWHGFAPVERFRSYDFENGEADGLVEPIGFEWRWRGFRRPWRLVVVDEGTWERLPLNYPFLPDGWITEDGIVR